jgi:membrane-bound lytic murein transglycosylase D
MTMRHVVRWLGGAVVVLAAACASGRGGRATPGTAAAPAVTPAPGEVRAGVDSLGAAVATTAAESALDQSALDSLRALSDESGARAAVPVVPTEEVEREAAELFGSAAVARFDIDVTSFAAHRRVLEYLHFFQVDARDRFSIWLSRLGRYEGMIRARLRSRGLPEDLIYLTLIESGLSNTAVSRAKAVGMWQFMAATGRGYGLVIDPWVDERRDPFKATEAAVNHLAYLVERLGSVYLAAAAYNAGAGRVERGIGRLPGEVDSLTDHVFFQLSDRRYLKRETRDYVPKLIAAALIAKQPERYGFTDIVPLGALVFDEVMVPDASGLDVIARLADTSVAALLELNPHFVRGVTPPGRAVTVRVPRGTGSLVAQRYADLPVTERVTFVDHYVTRGETLSEIARRYRVSQAMIQAANPRLRPRALRVGQRLIVPMSGRIVPPSAWSAPHEPSIRRVAGVTSAASTYRVRAGDTASGIARRFGVGLAALLNANGLTMGSVIRPGDRMRIPTKGTDAGNQAPE